MTEGVNQTVSPVITGNVPGAGAQGVSDSVGKHKGLDVVVLNDVEPTPGLKQSEQAHAEESSPPPTLRERRTRKASESETRSIRESFTEGVKKRASKLKSGIAKKTRSLTEAVTSKAKSLKSHTFGDAKRAVLKENWKPATSDALAKASPKMKELLTDYNNNIERLELLKEAEKAKSQEESGFKKEFENEFKAELKLLDGIGQQTKHKGPVSYNLPGGGEVKVHTADKLSREEALKAFADEFRETPDFQRYQAVVTREKSTERSEIKKDLKFLTGEIKKQEKQEVMDRLREDQEKLNERMTFTQASHDTQVDELTRNHARNVATVSKTLRAAVQDQRDYRDEAQQLKDDIQDAKNDIKNYQKEVSKYKKMAKSKGPGKEQALQAVRNFEVLIMNSKVSILEDTKRLGEIPGLIKAAKSSESRLEARLEVLEKGKDHKKALKEEDKKLEKAKKLAGQDDKESLKAAKKERSAFMRELRGTNRTGRA